MKITITGGAGFIGNHAAEYFAKKGNEVVVFDDLSRSQLLKKEIKNSDYNWNYLKKFSNIKLIKGDIRNTSQINEAVKNADAVIHAAAQTAVTVSIDDPRTDFETNAIGTFNVLEASRKNDVKSFIYCSTNKVYGDNVNTIEVTEDSTKYSFKNKYGGIPETFSIDLCEHTPYGCSKLTGDIFTQDYGRLYGMKTGVFRMSCIYGPRQFGVEDQGWVAWFSIATISGRPITIYGNGKQVRDVLYVTDLIDLFDKFTCSSVKCDVFNTGGGHHNTLSLLELIDLLEKLTSKKSKITFSGWRPSDQKVYISDISKAIEKFNWRPKVTPREGVVKLVDWITKNKSIF